MKLKLARASASTTPPPPAPRDSHSFRAGQSLPADFEIKTREGGGRGAQQQRGALSVTEGALANIRFGLVTTQKSRRR